MRIAAGLALLFVCVQSAFATSDPSCIHDGGGLPFQCSYKIQYAGAATSQVSVLLDQPQNVVLHAGPGDTLVSYRESSQTNSTNVTIHSNEATAIIVGKVFPRLSFPVLANHDYPTEGQIVIEGHTYYLLRLAHNVNYNFEYFLIDAADGSVYERAVPEGLFNSGNRRTVSLAVNKTYPETENYRFTFGSSASTEHGGSDTRALVFNQVFGMELRMVEQSKNGRNLYSENTSTTARAGDRFDWHGITIEIVSASSAGVAYKIISAPHA